MSPKRVIDADAMWDSTKLARCRAASIPEYAWLYGIADPNGNFELSNIRSLHGKAYAAIRPTFSQMELESVLEDFERNGLLYTWWENGKKYGHWVGSDKPGRLPPKSQRNHYPKLAVRTPTAEEINAYLARVYESFAVPTLFDDGEKPKFAPPPEEEYAAPTHAHELAWEAFEKNYPQKISIGYARKFFWQLTADDLPRVLAGLELWNASPNWKNHPHTVPYAENFIEKKRWLAAPEQEDTFSDPGRKTTHGPAGRTSEEHLARIKKNAKIFGLSD